MTEHEEGHSLTRFSYLYDPGSSVSLLLDSSSGLPEESYGYNAYGSANSSLTKKASGFSTGTVPTNPVRFQGKRWDSGSSTYDMGARRYSASAGRWLQQDFYYDALDNLGLSQDPLTANRYAFLGANPVNYVEVDGHFGWNDVKNGAKRGASWAGNKAKKHAGTIVATAAGGPLAGHLYAKRSSIKKAAVSTGKFLWKHKKAIAEEGMVWGTTVVAGIAATALCGGNVACGVAAGAGARALVAGSLAKARGRSWKEAGFNATLAAVTSSGRNVLAIKSAGRYSASYGAKASALRLTGKHATKIRAIGGGYSVRGAKGRFTGIMRVKWDTRY